MVVKLKSKKRVKKILDQKVMYDQETRTLVVARLVVVKPDEMRIVEIKGVKDKENMKEVREVLKENGGEVYEQKPTEDEWTVEYRERMIWKIKGELTSWKAPAKIRVKSGNLVRLVNAPLCNYCHGDDHHKRVCQWPSFIPDLAKI